MPCVFASFPCHPQAPRPDQGTANGLLQSVAFSVFRDRVLPCPFYYRVVFYTPLCIHQQYETVTLLCWSSLRFRPCRTSSKAPRVNRTRLRSASPLRISERWNLPAVVSPHRHCLQTWIYLSPIRLAQLPQISGTGTELLSSIGQRQAAYIPYATGRRSGGRVFAYSFNRYR